MFLKNHFFRSICSRSSFSVKTCELSNVKSHTPQPRGDLDRRVKMTSLGSAIGMFLMAHQVEFGNFAKRIIRSSCHTEIDLENFEVHATGLKFVNDYVSVDLCF